MRGKGLLEQIKKSRKYSSIADEVIKDEIKNYFKINPKAVKYLDNIRSKKYKGIIKAVRAKLHLIYGSFQDRDREKRVSYLRQIYGINDYKNHDKVLSTSVSSKERLNSYGKLYKEVFRVSGKPRTLLDLGCGLNPVSYPYMGISKLRYYAYDIDKGSVNFLNKYFSLMKKYNGLTGKAFLLNLKNISSVKKLPKADICLMFKVLDSLEQKGHKLSESIIKSLNCKFAVVSFSTKTVSGKRMRHPYRGWIEKMLDRIGLKYEKLFFSNEVFYVISSS